MYAWLVGAIILLGTTSGAFFYGVEVGSDREVAADAREKRIAQIATDAATSAAASAIAQIKVSNVTIQQKLQREVLMREVFRDCRSGDDAVRLLNASPGIAQAASATARSSQLPASGAAR